MALLESIEALNIPRKTSKANYGLVSVLHTIQQRFEYGNFDLLKDAAASFIPVIKGNKFSTLI